jgi:hypothetical protein
MRVSFIAACLLAVASLPCIASGKAVGSAPCRTATIEGEVSAGSSFTRPIGSGLEVMLEALPSGWILRVLPEKSPRPAHDYAEIATPPYHSVTSLLISTDYSFRAQDAIGWNLRRFHFVDSAASYQRLLKAYDEYESHPTNASSALIALVNQSPEGRLTIVDAKLVTGTADQPRYAAEVASHFEATAHTIEAPSNGRPTPLGRINWMRFRISLAVPPGFQADRSLAVKQSPCGQL